MITCWAGVILIAFHATFHKVSCNQQGKMLEPKVTSKANNFFTLHNGCVFSSTNSSGIALLQERSKGCMKEADGYYIFPLRAFFTLTRAKQLGAVLQW